MRNIIRAECLAALLVFFMTSTSVYAAGGLFIWDSASLYGQDAQSGLKTSIAKHDLNRLYWGVNAHQVGQVKEVERQLSPLISDLKKSGVSSWLLLGDPAWMDPRQRYHLLNIVRRMELLPFEGIMLDLEVEQLGFPVPPERLVQWRDTVQAVIKATGKPVSITAHWRWFDPALSVCMSCEFSRLGVHDVSLMIYSTNIDRVSTLVQNITEFKGLRFRLAQSIEPSLGADESWALRSSEHRKELLPRLQQKIGNTPIDWQAYEFAHYLD